MKKRQRDPHPRLTPLRALPLLCEVNRALARPDMHLSTRSVLESVSRVLSDHVANGLRRPRR